MNVFSSRMKRSQIDKLVEENDELKNTLHTVLQKHQSLTELDNKLNDARSNLTNVLKDIERQKNSLQNVIEEIASKSESLKELEERKTSLEDTISILQINSLKSAESEKDLAIKQTEIQTLTEQYNNLQTSVNHLKDEYNSIQQNLTDLKDQEKKVSTFIHQYGGISEDSVAKLKETEKELSEKISQLKIEESKRSGINKSLEEKILLNEEIKSNLESSLAGIIGQLSEKERMFADFTDRRDSIVEELNRKQKEFDEFDAKYNFEKETLQKLESEIDELSTKKRDLTEELGKFESVRSELQDKILVFKKEEERITDELITKHDLFDEREKRKFQFEEDYLKIEKKFSGALSTFIEEFEEGKNKLSSLRLEILEKEKELNTKEKALLEKATQLAEYGGLAKVLQKERAATEQLLTNLKEEYQGLNEEILTLRDEANKHRTNIQQLRAETQSLEIKKDSVEKEVRQLINLTSEDYTIRTEEKQKLNIEINENDRILENLKDQVSKTKEELRSLKAETSNIQTKKEEYTSKISELIAMEKNLRFKISEHEKRINNVD
jgi:chromosome segregation ATPase